MAELMRLKGIGKTFWWECALCGVDFDLIPGEIHALVRENGAEEEHADQDRFRGLSSG